MRCLFIIAISVLFIGAMPIKPFTPRTYWVTTTGFLNLGDLEGAPYNLVGGDTLALTAGSCTGIFIQNTTPTGQIIVKGSDSLTYVNGGIELNACKSIMLLNIKAHDVSGRWIVLEETKDSISIVKCRIDRSNDYQIYLHTATPYNGSNSTSFDGIVLSLDTLRGCANANVLSTNGAVTRNIWIHDCFTDSTYGATGSGFSFTDNAIDYLIENNKFTNINLGGTSHNAVLYIQGYGTVRNNLCLNRQGDFIRCRPYWVDSSASNPTPDTTYIYNNRDCGARKYAFVEHEQKAIDTTTNTNLPNTRTGICIITNNTSGNTRTADYTPFGNGSGGGAGFIDAYERYRPNGLFVKNNLCYRAYIDSIPDPYNVPARFTFDPMFHNGGGTKPAGEGLFGDTSNNQYFNPAPYASPNWTGNDTLVMNIVYNAPPRGRGTNAYLYLAPNGYRGNARVGSVDIGADQFNTWSWHTPFTSVILTHR